MKMLSSHLLLSHREGAPSRRWRSGAPFFLFGFVILPLLVSIFLRFYSLSADPDWRLDWNPGLLTDEAFYMHNARNAVLFGQARLDEFNNMVISPVVHWLHFQVFRQFGVGYLQGRAVSALLSVISLLVFFRCLTCLLRLGGLRSSPNGWSVKQPVWFYASLSTLWLGFEHTYLLFNRTALLETPLAFFSLLSLWALGESLCSRRPLACWLWGLLAGVGAMLALITKMTALSYGAALLIGLILIFRQGVGSASPSDGSPQRVVGAVLAGMGLAGAIWFFTWLLPNWREWWHLQSYYALQQVRPRSLWELWLCLQRALVGERYGLSHFLFVHMPLTWVLNLLVLAALVAQRQLRRALSPLEWVFVLWVLFGWLQMATIRLAPTRYFVAFLPAMVGLTVIAFTRWQQLRQFLQERKLGAWFVQTLSFAWIAYFGLVLLLPDVPWRALEFPVMDNGIKTRLLLAALLIGALGAYLSSLLFRVQLPTRSGSYPFPYAPLPLLLLCLFLLINTFWYVGYFSKRTYSIQGMNRLLTEALPPKSVLVGIAFETPFRYFFVFKGLCNWRKPVEEYGATHVLLLGSEETLLYFYDQSLRFWYERYPGIQLHSYRLLGGEVGPYRFVLYQVPQHGSMPGTQTAGKHAPFIYLVP